MRRIVLAVAASLFLAPVARAVDGVLEINQACAVQTGCFSGDAPGFPVQITAPGSYRLTTNLVLPDADTTGISLSHANISIDLEGFEIVTSDCLGATSDCTPAEGTGDGVAIEAGTDRGITLKNGSITGMGQSGVYVGFDAVVRNLQVRWNRTYGIRAGHGSMVSGNTAYGNGGDGIYAYSGSTVSDNRVYGNGGFGIYAYKSATISGNTSYQNLGTGIGSANGSTVSGNTVYGNGAGGIVAQFGSTVSGNTVRDNTGLGFALSGAGTAAPGYTGNVISGNSNGTVNGGVEFGTNLCNGDTTCP